jgi:hypothetical protein
MSSPKGGPPARPNSSSGARLAATHGATHGAFPTRLDWVFLAGVTALYILFFWPGIAAGHLLAPGDGRDYFLPMFLAPKTLWDPAFQNGYPVTGDPQVMTWYPVARIFGLLGSWGWVQSWNAFILFGYIGAACWMYLYAFSLVGKRAAAAVSGVVYSMTGFMMGHLGHVTFINAACWIPGVLLGLEQAARKASWRWAMAAAGCLSMIFLSGNPQLTLYTCLFSAARLAALVVQRQARMRSAFASLAGMAAVTGGLCAIQLLPSRELQLLSERAAIDYTFFSAYSLHPVELLTGLFPFVLGSRGSPIYPQPYIGWSWVEGAFHVGFMVLFLALAALSLRPKRARFWGYAFVAAVLLASDGTTALGPLLFRLPVYQLFRSHGRWMLYADFSAALLAGHGFAALLEGIAWRDALRLAGRFLVALAVACFALFSLAPFLHDRAAQLGFTTYQVSLHLNAVRIPLAIALIGAAVLIVWMRYPRSRVAPALAACLLLASLASAARYEEWRTWPLPFTTADVQPPAALDAFGREARARQGSLLALDPSGQPTYEGEPLDYCRFWRWPSLSFYHPLYVARLGEILSLDETGSFIGDAGMFLGQAPDLFGLLFVSVATHPAAPTVAYGNLRLPEARTNLMIGNPANGMPEPRSAQAPIPADAQKILLTSALGNSAPIKQGDTVAEAVLSLASGRQAVYPIRAGIDTAEYALECVDVRPFMQHGLAPVFSTRMFPRAGGDCPLHDYIATIALGTHDPILQMTLRYVHPLGDLMVSHVWFVRPDGSVSASEVTSAVTESPLHWRSRGSTPHARVFENLRVMDRAWVVPAVRKLAPGEIQQAIRSGAFPDGSPFDPRQTALVERDVAGWASDSATAPAAARVSIAEPANTALDVSVDAPARGFLVVRDVYYPGWHAYRNGAEVPIYQTNYIQRGMVVEPGQNRIRFEYSPAPFRLGAGIMLTAASFALATCWHGRLRSLMERLFGPA